jgi:hypothetical protein
MASQFGNLPPGAAPLGPRPASPRGLYRQFGMPERLLRIHFPEKDPNKDPATSNPWYWWFDLQQPFEFSFLFTSWFRLPDFSIIKILQIDSQTLTPIPKVGHATLEDAVKRGIPDTAWGRIDFKDDRFWGLITDNGKQNKGGPKAKPKFNEVNGQIKARDTKTDINGIISAAANRWQNNWNGDAKTYNALASGVGAGGFHYPGQPSLFSIPLPAGPPTTIAHFAAQLNNFVSNLHGPWVDAAYLSSVPASAHFNINTFTTDATAFTVKVGQLNPKKWNMSVFPPLDSTLIGNGSSSQISGDYSGFGQTPFPVTNPSA